MSSESFENLSYEDRTFPPSQSFIDNANTKSDIYDQANKDRLAFWEKQANRLSWDKKWDQVVDWQLPFAKWFVGGKLNASFNCLDRHVLEGRGERVAFHFEGEPGDTRTITYAQLLSEVCKTTNALIELGIKQGVKIGSWKGMLDVAAFVNEYSNMMEFSFIYFNPISQLPLNPINPTPEDIQFLTNGQYNVADWVGFQAQNAEKARITGIDISFNSSGKLGNVELISLLGYTYMNPISLNKDPLYAANFSDPNTNMLKYRFKHLAKADIEANYKQLSFGASCRYSSFMSNIDRTFEDDLDPSLTSEVYILPGLTAYRQKYNKGNLVFDFRE